MTDAVIDLTALVKRLTDRKPGRTEANVQADLHAFLLAAPFQLDAGQVEDVLEQQAGQGKRIDVEAGFGVFEVKRDLRKGNVKAEAIDQLAEYVAARTKKMGHPYVGVLTDGCEWYLYRLRGADLVPVAELVLRGDESDVEKLCVWIEGILAIGEKTAPTPTEVASLLGAGSPGYLLAIQQLSELHEASKDDPAVKLKRELWAKLLTTAQGSAFKDDDQLFIQHTLLVVTAEIIAHAVLGLETEKIAPIALISGQHFRRAKVLGVVEADFFDWVAEVPGGDVWVRHQCRRLARFAWEAVEHDVMKVLYESVIPAEQRKQLGEYYTPDWLAQKVVEEVVPKPLSMRVLDPSCGSGTFVFHAVRRYLEAAQAAKVKNREALAGVCANVMGMDLHPVAVTLARVTYLLAIGAERLRDRDTVSIPVFLGDSLQWGQEEVLQTHGSLVVRADTGLELFPRELRFPDSLVDDVAQFDALVSELADRANQREAGSKPPSLSQVHQRFGIPPEDRDVLDETFKQMCNLRDQGRDHIWGYYVRNLARPRWLARELNHVDALVGNPPWLSFRYMTQAMQDQFKRLTKERGLWAGAKSATHVDLSALFVVRCIERYLKQGGAFGFVVPLAVLSRQQFEGFRSGRWPRPQGFPVAAAFRTPWDLHEVKPTFFEVPCSVVLGDRVDEMKADPIPDTVKNWSGRLPSAVGSWEAVAPHIKIESLALKSATTSEPSSPYAERFAQGATLVPRMTCFVEELPAGPLGTARGEIRIRSRRSATEKKPWKDLPAIEATVERPFVIPVHVGDTILPYRPLEPLRGLVPWDGKQLLHGGSEHISMYPGLQDWMTQAEKAWAKNRSSDRLDLVERWDFQKGLSKQFLSATGLCPGIRLVYTKSGMYLAAAVIDDPAVVIDHKLYWATCGTLNEARYLCAILNSEQITLKVRSFQARGEHNPRDFDMYVWQLPIPMFDKGDARHKALAALAGKAEEFVAKLELPDTRFEKQRRFVREQLAATEIGKEIEATVAEVVL